MKGIFIFLALLISFLPGCKTKNQEPHPHEEESSTLQLQAYSKDWEIFSEADPLIINHTSQILSHITHIPSFKPVDSALISLRLEIQGKEYSQTLKQPVREGIYLFTLTPTVTGRGNLTYDIQTDSGNFQILLADITVYENEEKAHDAIKEPSTNLLAVFTKEQSWKVDFATGYPGYEMFGQLMKSSARIQSFPTEERFITASSDGMIVFGDKTVLPGMVVSKGEHLFSIAGMGLHSDNSIIIYQEAKNNFDKARDDYNRTESLWKDKIVSEKDWLIVKNDFLNAKNLWDNIRENFSESGQKILAPMDGYIKDLHVRNGESVIIGQTLVVVSSNNRLMLVPEVPQRYFKTLSDRMDITVKKPMDNRVFSMKDLKARILSFGKSTENSGNMIPVYIKIEDTGNFFPGEWVEVNLKSIQLQKSITVPNSALLEEQGHWYVYTQVTPESFEKREVKPGASDGIKTEIQEGLNPGERIVLRGAIYIKLAQASGKLDAHSGHVH